MELERLGDDAIASAQARVIALQRHTDRLSKELHRVTAQLSARTARSVRLTVAHTETADNLAANCVASADQLRSSAEAFLNDVGEVRASLGEIAAIAKLTQDVRAELVRLEALGSRIAASSSS